MKPLNVIIFWAVVIGGWFALATWWPDGALLTCFALAALGGHIVNVAGDRLGLRS